MKNFKIFALMLVVGAMIFASCGKEDPTGPTISVTPVNADAIVNVATDIDFDYTISSNAKIKELTVVPNDGSISSQTVTTFNGDFSATGTITLTVPGTFSVGNVIEVVFTATDDDGEEYAASTTVEITVIEDPAGGDPITTYTAKIMGAQSNATLGSFMDAETGTVYLSSGAASNQALIDFVYYYGSTNFATICAPNDVTVGGGSGNLTLCQSWTTKNATMFKGTTLTSAEFDAIDDDSAFTTTTDESLVASLAVGNVVAFETVGGKKGLFKVTALTTGSTGEITVNVKIQQ